MTDCCEICHEWPPEGEWRALQVCPDCLRHGEEYDAMTPEERRRDDEAQARYVALHGEDR